MSKEEEFYVQETSIRENGTRPNGVNGGSVLSIVEILPTGCLISNHRPSLRFPILSPIPRR